MFDIPIVLLMFKREKIVQIIDRLREVKPQKVYLICDGGRNENEWNQVNKCRELAEKAIDWQCTVIKNYADHNRGVYGNIGEGAKWIFSQEKWAIFLEDDNLPEVTFFRFCKEMLEKYENDNRVLWVCGTNYLERYNPIEEVSYCFTKHLLPCGWASWASKFLSMYDGELKGCEDPRILRNIGTQYIFKSLYRQYRSEWMNEYNRHKQGKRFISWDMQMDFSLKANSVYGICPVVNQIENIGVDEASIHGGSSKKDVMTQRFCGMRSHELEFPLIHPSTVMIDEDFEKKIGKIILRPWPLRIKSWLNHYIRIILKVPDGVTTKKYIKNSLRSK